MVSIARTVASEADLQMRMQGIVLLGAFLRLTPYATEAQMTDDQVYAGVEKALRKYFGKRGDRVVQDNLTCVKRGYSELQEIPADSDEVINDRRSRLNAHSKARVRTPPAVISFLEQFNDNGQWHACTKVPSMNEASERDPFNNNSYGTLVDSPYKTDQLARARRE